jgi:hypothetical protein
MPTDMLVITRTALRRYVFRRDDLLEMRSIAAAELRSPTDTQPYIAVELGEWLDPRDRSAQRRRHALIVPLRRRFVALLVDSVETFVDKHALLPLPPLLHTHMREPWAIGVLPIDDDIAVALDARAIARSALSTQSPPALRHPE